MKEKVLVIPIFIPHAGCPHDCIYCNQKAITGESVSLPTKEKVEETIKEFLGFSRIGVRKECYVAFYGGTFTALPRITQEQLLGVAQDFVDRGLVKGIRFSTRPDYITSEELDFLEKYNIVAIELGAQSMDDAVLKAAARGHTAETTSVASRLIKDLGLELGIQVMIGLPKETEDSFRRTIREVISLGPGFVRIYPTLVVKDSALAEIYRLGKYKALSLEKAVKLALEAYTEFKRADIRVIRMGLQAEPWFDRGDTVIAGPYHPSFGELVVSAYYDKLITPVLKSIEDISDYIEIRVPVHLVSQVRGHRNTNIRKWTEMFGVTSIEVKGINGLQQEITIRSGKREWKINSQEL